MSRLRFVFGLLFLLVHLQAFALSQVSATVDSTTLALGQSAILTVNADDNLSSNAFNTQPLLKSFVVGPVSISHQTRIINGSRSETTQWSVPILPRSTGRVVIPELKVKGLKSKAIELNVLQSAKPQSSSSTDAVRLESSVDERSILVGQQLLYTLTLYSAVPLQNASMDDPKLDDATIKRFGNDATSDRIINGRKFRVIRRHYLISAHQPGSLRIKGPLLQGEIVTGSGGFGLFATEQTEPLLKQAPDLIVTVKPKPKDYQGTWLPSEEVNLTQSLSPQKKSYQVGEPITRTLTLTAAGVSQEQLPDLTPPTPKGFRSYPGKTQSKSFVKQGSLLTQNVYQEALIPQQAGTFTLPEIKVPWWNTHDHRRHVATIAAQTIKVVGAPQQAAPLKTVKPLNPPSIQAPLVQLNLIERTAWLWFALFWLLLASNIVCVWLGRRSKGILPLRPRKIKKSKPAKITAQAELKALEKILQGSSTTQGYQALTHYLARYHPDETRYSEALKQAIANYRRTCFAPNTSATQELDSLLAALKSEPQHRVNSSNSANTLPPLNP